MHPLKVQAVYQDTGVPAYKGNPFIEALPPLLEAYTQTRHLRSSSDPSLQDLCPTSRPLPFNCSS